MSLVRKSLREISEMLQTGQIMATELLNDYLSSALKGSCISFCSEQSVEAAGRIDRQRLYKVHPSPLDGFPFSVKDNIRAAGIPTTCNSRSLKSYIPEYDAFIVKLLTDLGAILTAKNCMREFSIGKIEDSAFELRSYLDWASTNINVNIGAFSIGTDIGMGDFYCGLWTFKPALRAKELLDGVITGSSSLERITLSTRKADDLKFLYPYICGSYENQRGEINPQCIKILVYDNLNMPDYAAGFLEKCGFSVSRSHCPFIDKAELIYDCILCTEFFNQLYKIGAPESEEDNTLYYELEHQKSRAEGFGYETKRLILTGAFLLSQKNKESTMKILSSANSFTQEMLHLFDDYDFIAAPAFYGDKLSKASAIASLAEVTIPFGDVLPFKLYALPAKEQLLTELACFIEGRL